MNKTTYQKIDAAYKRPQELDDLTALAAEIQQLAESARDDWDSKSERWQQGEAGDEESTRISHLEDLANEVEAIQSAVDTAKASIEGIMETAPEGAFDS